MGELVDVVLVLVVERLVEELVTLGVLDDMLLLEEELELDLRDVVDVVVVELMVEELVMLGVTDDMLLLEDELELDVGDTVDVVVVELTVEELDEELVTLGVLDDILLLDTELELDVGETVDTLVLVPTTTVEELVTLGTLEDMLLLDDELLLEVELIEVVSTVEDVVGACIVEVVLVEVVPGAMTEEVEEDDMDVADVDELMALLYSYRFRRLLPPHFSAVFPAHVKLQSDAGAVTLPS
ncbi:MAG: hypothetical protein LQ350_006482 [Teloschistes chrysophthalmus]|nr:MAG: hypothetical protein LQ350_006482 [Niorma chrysophthalma]